MEAKRRQKFIEKVNGLIEQKGKNSIILSEEKFDQIVQALQRITSSGAKNSKDYRIQTRFQLLEIDGNYQLIKNGTEKNS